MEQKNSNRLLNEKSPYLLQHAHNPVDWFPWGQEAFDKARQENKPIFLSVGYSTCHWCHVMERESFENPEIAALMNKHFVNIKVDREERPDVDKMYMAFVQATTGGGGWPMSVWLTPDLHPFVGGTYFPPVPKFGQTSFPAILQKLASVWGENQEELKAQGSHIIQALKSAGEGVPDDNISVFEQKEKSILKHSLNKYFNHTRARFDSVNGGFGKQPKFPRPVELTGLFYFAINKEAGTKEEANKALDMAEFTLNKMYLGGMHDHVGGGFHRYSVDKFWHVPHFEKMLYDQGQLVTAYLTLYRLRKSEFAADAARDILNYVKTSLLAPEGGFYSAEDADSYEKEGDTEKKEGAFYVWTKEEITRLLGKEADLFCEFYGVTQAGNAPPGSDPHDEFVGKNILIQRMTLEQALEWAKEKGLPMFSTKDVADSLARSRKILYDARNKRPHCFLDDKIIAAWNGLMISAFALASRVLNDKSYHEIARGAMDFIKGTLMHDGQLYRSYRGERSAVKAFADDYANTISAALDMYECFGDFDDLRFAIQLQDIMDKEFYDEENGGYFLSPEGDENLKVRSKEEYDGAEPSPNSYAVANLARLAHLLHKDEYLEKARRTLMINQQHLLNAPFVLPHSFVGLTIICRGPTQVVIAGPLDSDETNALAQCIFEKFLPHIRVLWADGGAGQHGLRALGLDFISEDSMMVKGKPAAYLCKDFACQLPVSTPNELRELLAE